MKTKQKTISVPEDVMLSIQALSERMGYTWQGNGSPMLLLKAIHEGKVELKKVGVPGEWKMKPPPE